MPRSLSYLTFFLLLVLAFCGILNSPIALISGFLFTIFFGKIHQSTLQIAIKYLLKLSIIGLGFGMFLEETWKIGKEGFFITFFTITLTIVVGTILTKVLKLDSKLGHLISSGTSICGGSAIAAVSSVIKAEAKTISIALGVVFFLNAIALFVFPVLGHYFNLNQHDFGLWAAIAIHDTSSVVGAALQYGEEALNVATTVKLARTLWIIPLSLLSIFFFKSKNGKFKFPWFILGFILAIIANSYLPIPKEITLGITTLSKRMLIATLFLVGTTLSIEDIRKTGIKPFILAISLWVIISISSLLIILHTS